MTLALIIKNGDVFSPRYLLRPCFLIFLDNVALEIVWRDASGETSR